MNSMDLLKAIGHIDDQYLVEGWENQAKNSTIKFNSKVICLVTSVSMLMLVMFIYFSPNISNLDINSGMNEFKEDMIVFNEGSIKITDNTGDEEGMWKNVEDLESEFSFLEKLNIPKEYYNSRQGAIYVKENDNSNDYSKLQEYASMYSVKGDNASIEIYFSKDEELRQCRNIKNEEFENSIMNNTNVKLFKTNNYEDKTKINGEALLQYNDYNIYVYTYKIDEASFINIVNSIVEDK